MATHDYNLANQDGASFRSDLNNALAAIVSNNSSSTAPATTFAHQIWVDTTANVIKQRNAANDAWIELWRIDGGFNAKTFSSNVTLNAQSDLRFADSDSSNWVAFQAPATVASNVTWTLPSADGTADQALTTNGSGVLSWADAGGTTDNITEGNTSAEVVDTGSDGHFKVVTEGTERFRIANDAVYTFTGGNSASDPGEIILSGRNSSNLTRPAGKFLIGPNGTDSWTGEFTLQLRDDGGTFQDRFYVSGKTGNVGIGTTSGGGNLTVAGTGDCNLDLVADSDNNGTNQWPVINFRRNSTTGTPAARIYQIESSGSLVFDNNGAERIRILSGGGLTFNGDTATANALDDYEEGTWTPGFSAPSGSAGSAAYSSDGKYVKIGQLVTAIGDIYITNRGSWSGTVKFGNLPFTAASGRQNLGACWATNIAVPTQAFYQSRVGPSESFITLSKTYNNGADAYLQMTDITPNSSIRFSVTYTV